MTVCIERKELARTAVSAVQNVNVVRGQVSQASPREQDLTYLSNALGSAKMVEREALEQLVMHRKQHGC